MADTEQVITVEQADRVLRQEYWDAVRDIATEIEDAVKSGEIEDEETYRERMREAVDQSAWVIYTLRNFQVLLYCNNSDAYTDEFGDPPLTDGAINWAAAAFASMLEDVNSNADAFDDIEKPEDAEEEEDADDSE